MVNEALGRRAAKHLKGDRQRNEAEITAFVDQLIEDELLRISEKRLPPEKTLVKYSAIFRDFAEWARANGVDALPAAGAVIFSGSRMTVRQRRFFNEFAR